MKSMRTINLPPAGPVQLPRVLAAVFALASTVGVQAQGIVTFDRPGITNGVAGFSLAHFDDMSFRVGVRNPPYDIPAQVGVGLAGHPYNGTPFAAFFNMVGTSQYMLFSRTNAAAFGQSFTDGAPFGLLSVDLADPVAPSLTPVSITFNGFKLDGSTVSQTFTVGGGGLSTFQTFLFNADFATGLARVEIPSAAWAMDNLVWIPEPSATGLFVVGLLTWSVCRRKTRPGFP